MDFTDLIAFGCIFKFNCIFVYFIYFANIVIDLNDFIALSSVLSCDRIVYDSNNFVAFGLLFTICKYLFEFHFGIQRFVDILFDFNKFA